MLPKGGADAQNGTPTPPSHGGEAGNTGVYTVQDLMEEVTLLEEVLMQMGASSKMPFWFTWPSRSLFEWSLITWASMTLLNNTQRWTCYCIYARINSLGGYGWSTPTFSCMEWIANCWYIAGSLSQRSDNQSPSPVTGGGHPIFWETPR